jgi:hypothetical protein
VLQASSAIVGLLKEGKGEPMTPDWLVLASNTGTNGTGAAVHCPFQVYWSIWDPLAVTMSERLGTCRNNRHQLSSPSSLAEAPESTKVSIIH